MKEADANLRELFPCWREAWTTLVQFGLTKDLRAEFLCTEGNVEQLNRLEDELYQVL